MVLSTLVDTFYQAGEYNMERSQDPCELAVWDDTVSQLLMNLPFGNMLFQRMSY